MADPQWRVAAAQKSLDRILTDLEERYAAPLAPRVDHWPRFVARLQSHWYRLFDGLYELYGWQYDFFYTLERLARAMVEAWLERPDALRVLDRERERDPDWFLSEDMVGLVLYVDLFADNLARLEEHIPYFRKLGLRYLHLMPVFATPRGDSDGGYAVSDYRSINPDIGSMEDLADLAGKLRDENISLVLDFVCNHTSDEHVWAERARQGDEIHRDYYLTFPDRSLPDQYQRNLREVFPTIRRGSFSYQPDMERWVWTTFHSFQWDLNYANADVLRAMVGETLFLANQGVEVLRLDAVPFIWKRLGTNCENQPEAHVIVGIFNAVMRIVAPCVLLKSEAIVHPDEVVRYVHRDKCPLSYNPLTMALLWEALATREVKLLSHALRHRSRLPEGCSWVNYLRCHDDIGWAFDDDDARAVGIDPHGHRRFLNAFYLGEFEGSFARGVSFQANPDTGDQRVSGTLSSLAGLEQAVELEDDELIELAVRRITMLWSIQVSMGGIPLLYAGDEYGQMNDYTYVTDPARVNDSRWVHRARRRWEALEDLADQNTLEWRFFRTKCRLFQLRKQVRAFRNGGMEIVETGNPHVFGYLREDGGQRVLVVCNFHEHPQVVPHPAVVAGHPKAQNLLTEATVQLDGDLPLEGYQALWLDLS